jgi:hypothetical protein
MYQSIPSAENYKSIERDLISQNKPISLTLDELKKNQDDYSYNAGYKTYTGYVLTQADADALNAWTKELNATRCIKTREYLKDRRHQQFCIISQQIPIKMM